jgi:alpha-glucosidase (family GH31 glycosyl hydrolase)
VECFSFDLTMVPIYCLLFVGLLCRYKSVYEVEEVVASYQDAKIPLDTQWMDIDYMNVKDPPLSLSPAFTRDYSLSLSVSVSVGIP